MKKYKIYLDTTKRYEKNIKLIEVGLNDVEVILKEIHGDLDVLTEIKDLLEQYNLTSKEIMEFIPNTGPGSFTGIKLGITTANILNWANGLDTRYEPNYGGEPNIQKSGKMNE